MRQVLISGGLIAPLALDTFALAAALGVAGLTGRDRLRVTLIFTAFEAGMPIVGILVGRAVGGLIGGWADYIAIGVLVVAGLLLLLPSRNEDAETRRLNLLAHARGLAVLGLGLSISLDELTIGLSAGLIGLSILTTVIWIGLQALVATQVGLRFGARLGESVRERAEWAAGAMLILLAIVLVALKLTGV